MPRSHWWRFKLRKLLVATSIEISLHLGPDSPARLHVGMTKEEVQSSCGPVNGDYYCHLWYYGRHQVSFDKDGKVCMVWEFSKIPGSWTGVHGDLIVPRVERRR